MQQHDYATHWRQAAPLPSGIAEHARASLRHLFLSLSAMANKKENDAYLRCLYCHYVFDDQKDDFERLIVELNKTGEFVDTDMCIKMLSGEKPIDKQYYHLSMDDGFRNNYTNAFPILLKHHTPAIFFVPTSLIEADWEKSKNYCLNIARYKAVVEMMNWKELLRLSSEGYEIGSHTRTHARFSDISDNKALMEDEILGSKKDLENSLNVECKYISWPFGTLTDADARSLRMVKETGYKACFGAYRGTVVPARTGVFSIPRHHFEVQWPLSHIKFFARGNMEAKR